MSRTSLISSPTPGVFTAISTPVGSGKTRAAVHYMAQAAATRQNFIYVAPTVLLLEQTYHALQAQLQDSGARSCNVLVIHSETGTKGGGSVFEQVINGINNASGNAGLVLLCTTRALLEVVSRIRRPSDWGLVLDEGFSPVDFIELPLGKRKSTRGGTMSAFLELFDVDEGQGNRVMPAPDRATLVREIGQQNWTRAGLQYSGFRPFAQAVTNPVLRVELVGCAKAAVEDGRDPMVASYVSPECFRGFREVLFMCALFEHTMLYHLWTRLFDVGFETHPVVNMDSRAIRNLHRDQGPYVSIGHLLHPEDNSSLHILMKSCSGEGATPAAGERVIDALVRAASAHFQNQNFLLQANARLGYEEGSTLLPATATVIPVVSHGLNNWSHFDNVAALAVTNPTPQQIKWLQEKVGLTVDEICLSYRLPTLYQGTGRCSVRNAIQTTVPKTFLVPSKADADALLGTWTGAVSLGQVGDLPKMSAPKAPKAEALARDLVSHLQALPGATRKVSLRSLKALLGDLHEETWLRARDIAMASSPGWVRVQQSIQRTP